MSRFTKILLVSPLADGRTWVLRDEFGYDVGAEGSGDTIDVPVGFLTDFASIPRILWWLFPKWGRYGNAAVIHDFCYWEQRRSRRRSDEIFLEAMGVLRVERLTRTILFWAVRLFGWWAWRRTRRYKAHGWTKITTRTLAKSIETRRDHMRAAS